MKQFALILSIIIYGGFNFSYTQNTCGTATALSLGCSSPTSFNLASLSSGIALPSSCPSATGAVDYWYSFTASGNEATINLDNTSGDASIAIYSGCTAGDLLQCVNNSAATNNSGNESLNITTLVDGQTYYVRVMSQDGNLGGGYKPQGTGSICVEVPSTPSSTCDYVFNMYDSYGDGWNGNSYEFFEDGVSVGSYTFTTGSSSSANVTLTDGSSVTIVATTGSFTYEVSWVLLDPFGNIVCSGGEPTNGATVCSFTTNCTGPDDPCGAIELSPQASICNALSYSTYDNSGYTDSGIADPGCGNYNGGDMWFKATVPVSGGFDVLTQANGLNDMALAIYSGTCSSLSLVSCSNNGSGNMPTETVSGLTAGDEVFIRVWDEGGNNTGTFNIVLDDPAPIYCVEGSAVPSGGANCVELTPATTAQNGCAWSTSQFDFTQNFDNEFTVNLGGDDAGADGLAFVIQNAATGSNTPCGASGGGIGADGITPSLIIEFDTWANGDRTDANILSWEPSCDHIAVETDGTLIQDGITNSAPAFGPVQASSTNCNIEDGADHTVRITYDASSNLFTIYFDGVQRLQFNFDLAAHFGSNSAYWGFTASTGGAVNQQSFCPGTLPGTLGISNFILSTDCNNNNPKIVWTSDVEDNISYFDIETSENGSSFESIGLVSAQNQTNNIYTYNFISSTGEEKYFRIKAVDYFDGITYSNISALNCNMNNDDINVSSLKKQLSIVFNSNYKQDTEIKIFDITGKLIYEKIIMSEKGRNEVNLNLDYLSNSIYIINLTDTNKSVSKKTIIK